jgi:hypothetical protein
MDWLTMNRLAEVLRQLQQSDEVSRLDGIVQQAQALRIRIRDVPNVHDCPDDILVDLGLLAARSGDGLIAEAIESRVAERRQPSAGDAGREGR